MTIAALGGCELVDSDLDGVADAFEIQKGWDPDNADQDEDGITDGVQDSDGDGLTDWLELGLGTDATDPTDPDGNDPDGDDLPTWIEALVDTNPNDADSDNGGDTDGYEINAGTNPRNTWDDTQFTRDDDNDRLSFLSESFHRSDPNDPDTDDDGLDDGIEVLWYGTSPVFADTDGDLLSDGAEVRVHQTNPLKTDTDGAGVRDGYEIVNGTNPNDPSDDVYTVGADTDGDGLTDDAELSTHLTNPLDADTDDDGLSDSTEVNRTPATNPLLADTDHGGDSDGLEVANGTDPTYRYDDSYWTADPDSDGLTNYDEIIYIPGALAKWGLQNVYPTDPNDPDSDDDGIIDSEDLPTAPWWCGVIKPCPIP